MTMLFAIALASTLPSETIAHDLSRELLCERTRAEGPSVRMRVKIVGNENDADIILTPLAGSSWPEHSARILNADGVINKFGEEWVYWFFAKSRIDDVDFEVGLDTPLVLTSDRLSSMRFGETAKVDPKNFTDANIFKLDCAVVHQATEGI